MQSVTSCSTAAMKQSASMCAGAGHAQRAPCCCTSCQARVQTGAHDAEHHANQLAVLTDEHPATWIHLVLSILQWACAGIDRPLYVPVGLGEQGLALVGHSIPKPWLQPEERTGHKITTCPFRDVLCWEPCSLARVLYICGTCMLQYIIYIDTVH